MTRKEDQKQLEQWLAAWQAAGPVLDQLRIAEIRKADTALAIEMLADAFESTRLHNPPAPTSGLVEQQRFFARWKP
jgi:hypothetical protein